MKKQKKTNAGGARPGAGRPGLDNRATIHIKLEMADKTAFVRAAQKSPERNLSQWMISAGKEKLGREKK